MQHFNWVDLVLTLGVGQGAFLVFMLLFIQRQNKSANRMLVGLLGIAVFMLFGRLIAPRIQGEWIGRIAQAADITIFLFGPLVYMYVRRLVFLEKKLYRLPWWHYFPVYAQLVYAIWTFTKSAGELRELAMAGSLNLIWFLQEAVGLLSFLVYILLAWRLWMKYKQVEVTQLGYEQSVRRFLLVFLGILSLLTLFWTISFVNGSFFFYDLKFFSYTSMWTFTPFFFYLVGYFSIRYPEILRMPMSQVKFEPLVVQEPAAVEEPTTQRVERDRLTAEEVETLQKALTALENQHFYIEAKLTLKKLADALETTPNNLSWLLNQKYGNTFYEYVNRLRVEAFLEKVANGEHESHTVLALALDVGFNSKSTFNKAFKAIMNDTPSNYIRSRKLALSKGE